jgi:hypothetical protein
VQQVEDRQVADGGREELGDEEVVDMADSDRCDFCSWALLGQLSCT